MPILDVGYRGWKGSRSLRALRWLVVAQTCALLAIRVNWIRRLLYFGWTPAFLAGGGLLMYEQALDRPEARMGLSRFLERSMQRPDLAEQLREDPASVRQQVWAQLLFAFVRYPQLILMVILFGIAAPRMISYDLRSRAYLIYFSRPLGPAEYLLGKSVVLWGLISANTVIPATLLYFAGIMLSPDFNTITQTWGLLPRIWVAGVMVAIPTSAVALCFSSLTYESRYAAFAWYMVWVLGWVTYGIMRSAFEFRFSTVNDLPFGSDYLRLVSPYHTLVHLQSWAYGITPGAIGAIRELVLVVLVTVAAIGVSYWRIAQQLRQ
jgi:hypothetical protein